MVRKLGSGFGSSLIVASGLTEEEADQEKERRRKSFG